MFTIGAANPPHWTPGHCTLEVTEPRCAAQAGKERTTCKCTPVNGLEATSWSDALLLGNLFLRSSVEVLSNAIERLKGSPASPGPKRVFRTVVSELARGLTCPCRPVGHPN